MYLISAYFDDKTASILQRWMNEIYEVTGNDFMIKNQVPPHMTISAFEQKTDEKALMLFEYLEKELKNGNVLISSVGEFFPYVIYGEAVQNEYLYRLSQCVYGAVTKDSDTKVSKYYKPLQWIPHVTFGKTLEKDEMKAAFEVLQEKFYPIEAKVERFGIAKPNPHRDLKMIDGVDE